MAAPQLHQNLHQPSSAFKVTLDDSGGISLFGRLGDQPQLAELTRHLNAPRTLDFHGVHFLSWLGGQKLWQVLTTCGHPLKLTNLPANAFAIFKMRYPTNSNVQLKSTYLRVLTSENNWRWHLWDLGSMPLTAAGHVCTVNLTPELRLPEPACFVAPSLFGTEGDFTFQSPMTPQHRQQLSFWIRFGFCLCERVRLAANALQAAQDDFASATAIITANLKSIEAVAQQLRQSVNLGVRRRMELFREKILFNYSNVAKALTQTERTLDAKVRRLVALADEGFNQQKMSVFVADMCHELQALQPALTNCGTLESLTEGLPTKAVLERSRRDLERLVTPTSTALQAIPSLLALPLSPDKPAYSWQEITEVLAAAISHNSEVLVQCQMSFQAIDLVSQFLAHLLAEGAFVIAALAGTSQTRHRHQEYDPMISAVREFMEANLVSDQEKHCYEFYLPKAASSDQDQKLQPGGIIEL